VLTMASEREELRRRLLAELPGVTLQAEALLNSLIASERAAERESVLGDRAEALRGIAEIEKDLLGPNPRSVSWEVRAMDEYHEDFGAVLWWRFPVVEPPYVGSPLDDDFPNYVTHWTCIAIPNSPDAEGE